MNLVIRPTELGLSNLHGCPSHLLCSQPLPAVEGPPRPGSAPRGRISVSTSVQAAWKLDPQAAALKVHKQTSFPGSLGGVSACLLCRAVCLLKSCETHKHKPHWPRAPDQGVHSLGSSHKSWGPRQTGIQAPSREMPATGSGREGEGGDGTPGPHHSPERTTVAHETCAKSEAWP